LNLTYKILIEYKPTVSGKMDIIS